MHPNAVPRGIEADFVLAPGHDGALPQGLSQEMEGLPEGTAGVLLVELGPEEEEEGVAATKCVGGKGGEVGEQGQALGLHRDGAGIAIADAEQLQATKGAQLEHSPPPLGSEDRVTRRK